MYFADTVSYYVSFSHLMVFFEAGNFNRDDISIYFFSVACAFGVIYNQLMSNQSKVTDLLLCFLRDVILLAPTFRYLIHFALIFVQNSKKI